MIALLAQLLCFALVPLAPLALAELDYPPGVAALMASYLR